MKKLLKRMLSVATVMLTMVVLAGPTVAKSLYVITDQDTYSPPTPLQAYRINANGSLTLQMQASLANITGAVGLAVDTSSATLFMSVEFLGTFQIYDALTMANLGEVTAPGASNLAGIVMDEKKGLLYTVDRGTAHLYVYKWDRTTKTLTPVGNLPVVLPTPAGKSDPYAYGIALDTVNDRLYVANATPDLYVYKTSDWSLAGTGVVSITSSNYAISVAIDSAKQWLYTGGAFYGDTLLVQKNLVSGAEKTVDTVNGVYGLGIDNATDYIYVTTASWGSGGDLVAYNTSLTQLQRLTNIGPSPVGLAIPTSGNIQYHPTLSPMLEPLLLSQ